MTKLVDVKKLQDEAKKEYLEETFKTAKAEVKAKMREIEDAEKVVRNLKRELEDLIEEITS